MHSTMLHVSHAHMHVDCMRPMSCESTVTQLEVTLQGSACTQACARHSPKDEVHPFMQMLRDIVTFQRLPLQPDELIGAAMSPWG